MMFVMIGFGLAGAGAGLLASYMLKQSDASNHQLRVAGSLYLLGLAVLCAALVINHR